MRNFDNNRSGGDRGFKRMYPAVCDKCGRECEVPFKPTGEKPVYCSSCFERKDNNSGQRNYQYQRDDQKRSSYGSNRGYGSNKSYGNRDFGNKRFENRSPAPKQPQNSRQLDMVIEKLDKIIYLLSEKKAVIKAKKVKKVKVKKEKVKVKAKKEKKKIKKTA